MRGVLVVRRRERERSAKLCETRSRRRWSVYVPSSTSASICPPSQIPLSRCRANNELLERAQGPELESQGQNPALTVLRVPHSLVARRCARVRAEGGGPCTSPAAPAPQSVSRSLESSHAHCLASIRVGTKQHHRGTSLMRSGNAPEDRHKALGMVLL